MSCLFNYIPLMKENSRLHFDNFSTHFVETMPEKVSFFSIQYERFKAKFVDFNDFLFTSTDALISLELINVNVIPDAKAIPRQDVLVLHPRLTGANSNSVVLMPNADLKMELENATVHLDIHMVILTKAVPADPEVG